MSGERKTTNERLEELQTADSYDSISVTGQSADWVFYNQSGGSYVIGHGGGATMQHSYCTDISWADAQPGDLVFYPDNSHVGIVGGWDANGELLIIHCASGYNNVVVTGLEGFTSIARPDYYNRVGGSRK